MIKDIKIGNRIIGLSQPVFISAEVGITCNGDAETAKKLIDAAKGAGVDAVKFQIINPDDKYSDKSLTQTYKIYGGEVVTANIYELTKKSVMSHEQWTEIKKYADERNVIMFATTDHLEGIDLMEKLNMPAYKIATWDTNFYPFVKKIAKLQKPTIVDLGASNIIEAAQVIDIFKTENNDRLIFVHCYHTNDYNEMNLRTIVYLRESFDCLSGFSASDADNDIDYLSLAYGPVYIEKKLTLNKKDPRQDHCQALEPHEMAAYVKRIHELAQARGRYTLSPSKSDIEKKQKFFRRLVAKSPIKKGEMLTNENVACRRPYYGGIGAEHFYEVLGREARKDLDVNEPITWDKI